jgi:DNA-binding PadR family transcriptional regulator
MQLSKETRRAPAVPLTPAVFHILLTLAPGKKHGYAIMKQVEADAGGSLRMGPGTLYGTLGRMVAAGMVRELEEKELDEEAPGGESFGESRRRYYRITTLGQRTLGAELARLRHALATARRKGVFIPARTGLE